jgi:hypothetical protein
VPIIKQRSRNRFAAPLREKTVDELLWAIRNGRGDAAEAAQVLRALGWTDEQIAVQVQR